MVKVYSADAVDFDNTHIAEVEPLTGESYEKINGLYTLTFEVPFQHAEVLVLDSIIEVDDQFYRVMRLNTVGTEKSIVKVYAESLFMVDMLDETVDSIFIDETDLGIVLTDLLNGTLFVAGDCSDILVSIYGTQLTKSTIINQLINNYQLELSIQGLQIALVQQIGSNNHVELRKGKNLKSIDVEEDISGVITKLIYTNSDGSYGGELTSLNVDIYSKPKVHHEVFETETAGETDAMAVSFLELNDKPLVTYKIEFADLYYSKEYELIKELEKVSLGDVVTVIHESFGIEIPVRIIELKRDIATHKNTTVVLGNVGSDFFDYQASLQEAKDTIDYAFTKRKLNAATLKGLKIVNETSEEITFEVTEEGDVNITGDAIIGGTLDANEVNIINFTADSGDVYYLMSDNARVSQMAVNELITMLIEEGKNEYHFIHVHGEIQEWKSAYRKYDINGDPLPDEQLTDSYGNLLYWTDGVGSGITKESTDGEGNPNEPVMTHPYDYETKMQIKFETIQLPNGETTKAPVIWLGQGTGEGLNGKGKIYKSGSGLEIDYYSTDEGKLRQILMDDKGISFEPAVILFSHISNGMLLSGSEVVMPGIQVDCSSETMIAFDAQIDIEADSELSVTAELRVSGEVYRNTVKKFYGAATDQLVFNGVLPKLYPTTHTIDILLSTTNGSISIGADDYHLKLSIRGGEAQEAKPWPYANIQQTFSGLAVTLAHTPIAVTMSDITENLTANVISSTYDRSIAESFAEHNIVLPHTPIAVTMVAFTEDLSSEHHFYAQQFIFNAGFDETEVTGDNEYVEYTDANGIGMHNIPVASYGTEEINSVDDMVVSYNIIDKSKIKTFTSLSITKEVE